jgi:hypothetical protein
LSAAVKRSSQRWCDPVLVDEVLGVATRLRRVPKQAPGQHPLAQPRAARGLHHFEEEHFADRVNQVFDQHHDRSLIGPDVDGDPRARRAAFGLRSSSPSPTTDIRQVSNSSTTPSSDAAPTDVGTLVSSAT